ncbi:DNA-processing protein DprA [Paenisporosarcina cavernae]|uniref:DNA-protecting protein DprA n=1 Tax=Paenisporosarcina cavernae TaxID=2320858 RepID=A0A385YR75_9BACL|nr:DNA-processing protein DprA [Paenisporosarcina cavernae]AYC29229.1 DNA-protecting protein DprA [Paenisporosarcina cavernae]
MNTSFEEKLLALHYVFPVPLNRIQSLLERDPTLDYVEKMSIPQLASVLKLSYDRSKRLQLAYAKSLQTSLLSAYQKHSIYPISYFHSNYPISLKRLYDPPGFLYAKGQISYLNESKFVAIIGSREAGSYSKLAMKFIIPPLVNEGAVIVSGMAKGADTFAHKETDLLGGKTIGVLGHGFFHQYPKENAALFTSFAEKQLLITEYPPYVGPKKWTFPLRNRIISGLSQLVIVTEAKEKSGTVSTMQHALDNGKEVFCVPGPISSPLSIGPHQLLLEGAKPIWNGYQAVLELQNSSFEK